MEDAFVENLRLLCSHYRSTSEVCRKFGFNRQQFARYLTGETRPSPHNLRRIASGFDVTIEDLLRPNIEFETSIRHKRLSAQNRVTRLMDRAFPGDLQKLRPLLGYYHMHFLVPNSPGSVTRSLIYIYEHEDKVFTKTIEQIDRDQKTPILSKYEGLASSLGNYIFLVEFETLTGESIVESMLFPPYRKKIDILTGLTFGVTSQLHRQPFASPIAWKYLGHTIDLRVQIRACGNYPIEDRRIDPRIRKYLQSAGPIQTLSSSPF